MTEEERIFAGQLFSPADPALVALKRRAHRNSLDYSASFEDETQKRAGLLADMGVVMGSGGFIQGPVVFHYGCHTRIGANFFANFNLTIQDDALVTIGDNCNFGPNVTIVTPVHPMLPGERRQMLDRQGQPSHLCYARPVTIGNDCWLCANVVVCAGVTIGDGCVVGAGSVVVRDLPPMSFAAGNPCRVIRPITQADSMALRPEILGGCQVE